MVDIGALLQCFLKMHVMAISFESILTSIPVHYFCIVCRSPEFRHWEKSLFVN